MTRLASALLCAPLLLAVPAHAEDDPQRSDIIVTANPPAPPLPGASDTVPAADLADRTVVSLRDALALSPGVIAQPRYGQEIRLSIRGSGLSRGYHLRGITLLQDGVPLNEADGEADFMEIDPRVLDRIDVIRGANAMAFGVASLGGAVNAVTPTGAQARGLDTRVEGGSWNTVRGLAGYGYGFADARGDVFVALSADRSDGDRDHATRSALRFNGNAGVHLSDTVETRFYASAQRVRQELPGALTVAQALARPRQAAAAALAGDQARDVDSLRLQNRTIAQLGAITAEAGGFFASKALNHPIFQVIDQQSTTGGFYARLDWHDGPLALRAGAIARFGGIASRRFVNVAGRKGALTFRAEQRAQTVDSYGEARLTPLAALTLIAGLDWEGGTRRQAIAYPAPALGRVSYDQLSPRFGAIARVTPGIELYANYSRSHELPGFTELAQIATFVPLAPQRAWTIEAGARGRWGPATFDVTAYRADMRGELLQFAVSPIIPASTFNAGRTRHQGIEAGLDLALTPWAQLRQSYTLSDFGFRDDPVYAAAQLPAIPRHYYHAELRLGTRGYTLVPRLEWVPRGAWVDYRNTVRAPGYAMLGLGGEAPLDRRVAAFVDLRNLTGKRAIGDIGAVILATPATQLAYPVERRALYAGLRARF